MRFLGMMLVAMSAVALSVSFSPSAMAACSDFEAARGDCADSFTEALQNFNFSSDNESKVDNGETLFDAGKECIDCMGDALKNQLNGGDGSDTTSQ